MKNKIISLLLSVFCIGIIEVSAQHVNKEPRGYIFKEESVPTTQIADLSAVEIQECLAKSAKDKEPVIAIGRKYSKEFKTNAKKLKIADGYLWQMKIKTTKASAIALSFDRFNLPPQAEFYIYNAERTLSAGPFTSVDCRDINNFATMPLIGKQIILELFEPNNVRFSSEIHISGVSLSDDELMLNISAIINLEPLDIGINCSQGQAWQKEKDATVVMLYRDPFSFKYYFKGTAYIIRSLLESTNLFLISTRSNFTQVYNFDMEEIRDKVENSFFVYNFESAYCNTIHYSATYLKDNYPITNYGA
ncbi:MAG: hypothetical protein KAI79_18245, partial [Bacteroidales bacterium]|nr:hypothetical protein [Bacteroidales bacterium]